VIDAIVPEPAGGAHLDYDEAARLLAEGLTEALAEIDDLDGDSLRRGRRAKFRNMGVFA
jgi:acetyl-CoA carboxylase carboxyl transferase subunit alpha